MKESNAQPDFDGFYTEMLRRTSAWIQVMKSISDRHKDDGLTQRERFAIALFQLSIDHYAAMHMLIESKMLPTARALFRAQIESSIRGLWVLLIATDDELSNFERKGEPPVPLNEMLEGLKEQSDHLWGGLYINKKAMWRTLSDMAHGGMQQITSRIIDGEISRPYSIVDAIKELLAWTAASYVAILGVLLVTNDEGDAKFILQGFTDTVSIYLNQKVASLVAQSNSP